MAGVDSGGLQPNPLSIGIGGIGYVSPSLADPVCMPCISAFCWGGVLVLHARLGEMMRNEQATPAAVCCVLNN